MEWGAAFLSKILDRGYDYYQHGLVIDYQSEGNSIYATVQGSKEYNVSVHLQNGLIDTATCECPYAAGGRLCKHMAAVLYFKDGQTKKSTAPKLKVTSVSSLIANATDEQVRSFLNQILTRDSLLADQFIRSVTLNDEPSDFQDYQQVVTSIFEAYMDQAGFIDYYSADAFATELADFMDDELENLIDRQALSLALKVVNYIALKLAKLDIDDSNGEIIMLLDECSQAWTNILKDADLPVKREAFTWFQKHLGESYAVYGDVAEEIWFNQFTEPAFLKRKLKWTAKELAKVEKNDDKTDSWSLDWEGGKWANYHLQVMLQLDSSDDEIKEFCLAHIQYQPVRLAYADFCIQKQEYADAAQLLIDGKRAAKGMTGVVAEYSHHLKDLYQQTGQVDKYRDELWCLLTEYEPGDIDFYRELKSQYPAKEWPAQRTKLFAAIPRNTDIDPLYAEDHLYRQLMDSIAKEPDLYGLYRYEKVLKPKFSDQLIKKYAQVVEAMATQTNNRKYYQKIVAILNRMLDYPSGPSVANEIVSEWRVKYARRSAMMDELKKFNG